MRTWPTLLLPLLLVACATTPREAPPPPAVPTAGDAAAPAGDSARAATRSSADDGDPDAGAADAVAMSAGDDEAMAALEAAEAGDPIGPGAFVRVADIGVGLCVIARASTGRVLVYDAGKGRHCRKSLDALLPDGAPIALLVLSHNDSDHIDGAPALLSGRHAERVLWVGHDREGGVIKRLEDALRKVARDGGEVIALNETPVAPGARFDVDDLAVTFVAGWGEDIFGLHGGEALNAKSIVIRLAYGDDSVLLTGDTMGKREGPQYREDCDYAEADMVTRAAAVPLASTVMTAPHHGGDDGSALCFIAAVDPTYVVFPAGNNASYRHPRKSSALRYRSHGIPNTHMFRTDRGDDEGPLEWGWLRRQGHRDPVGDDHVDIHLRGDGDPAICYSDSVEPVLCE